MTDDFIPHLSELDLDPDQVILVENDMGEMVEMTVSEALAEEDDAIEKA